MTERRSARVSVKVAEQVASAAAGRASRPSVDSFQTQKKVWQELVSHTAPSGGSCRPTSRGAGYWY
eukprot:COSAG01_NODE_5071_length_4507_cov_1.789927_2_plen_66_part_00